MKEVWGKICIEVPSKDSQKCHTRLVLEGKTEV